MGGHIRTTSFVASCPATGLMKFIMTQPSRGETGYDKLYKVCLLFNLVLEKFKSKYTPTQSLSINENMMVFKR